MKLLERFSYPREFEYDPGVPRYLPLSYRYKGTTDLFIAEVGSPRELYDRFRREYPTAKIVKPAAVIHPRNFESATPKQVAEYLIGKDYYPPKYWQVSRWLEPRWPTEVLLVLEELRRLQLSQQQPPSPSLPQ